MRQSPRRDEVRMIFRGAARLNNPTRLNSDTCAVGRGRLGSLTWVRDLHIDWTLESGE